MTLLKAAWRYVPDYIEWLKQLHFGKAEYLNWVLAFSIAAIFIYLAVEARRYLWRKKNFPGSSSVRLISRWPSWYGNLMRLVVFVLALLTLAVLALEPINKIADQKPVKEPSFVAVGLDISFSMLASSEASGDKFRLDLAKEQIERFVSLLIEENSGDKLALFTFAEEPFLDSKDFSDDYARVFLPVLSWVNDIYVRSFGYGTDLAKVIDFCGKVFPKSDYKKFCVIFTDGELEGNKLEKLEEEFQKALEKWRSENKGVKLYFIAVGSSNEAMKIPILNNFGTPTGRYELDDNGKEIRTRVRPDDLRKAALKADAGFFHLKSADETEGALSKLIDKDKKIVGWKSVEKVDDVSEHFIKLFLLLLLLIFFLI